jgi:hypothetical protein
VTVLETFLEAATLMELGRAEDRGVVFWRVRDAPLGEYQGESVAEEKLTD